MLTAGQFPGVQPAARADHFVQGAVTSGPGRPARRFVAIALVAPTLGVLVSLLVMRRTRRSRS